jgi:hypothetical protein
VLPRREKKVMVLSASCAGPQRVVRGPVVVVSWNGWPRTSHPKESSLSVARIGLVWKCARRSAGTWWESGGRRSGAGVVVAVVEFYHVTGRSDFVSSCAYKVRP